MGMGMATMVRPESRIKLFFPVMPTKQGCLSLLLTTGCVSTAQAEIWGVSIKPAISFSQAYSDNLTLRPSSLAQSGFVTQLAPALGVKRDTANAKFDLNARLQYLYYEDINLDARLYPQLQMTSKTELYDDSIFVDSSSTIGQGNASSIGGVSSSNMYQSPLVNSTTYRTFRFSPYWTPHLGGYAEGEFRLGYYYFGNNSSSSAAGAATNTNIVNLGSNSYQESIHLKSGKNFNSSGLTWRMSFNNQDQHSQTSSNSNVRFRSSNGEVSYKVIGDTSLFVQGGYYDNQYSGTTVAKNGFYVTPGLSWAPSSNFSLAGGYGYNAYMSNVNWMPSDRTSFQLNYRNSQVGGSNYGVGGGSGVGGLSTSGAIAGFDYNPVGGGSPGIGIGSGAAGSNSPTGALGATNAGTTWNGSLHHHTRSTNWTASYYTTTTTIQQLLTNTSTFTTQYDANGNPITEATAIERAINTPNYTNGVTILKRAQASVTWTLSKSNLLLNFYHNNTTYSSINNRPQDTFGITTSWNWRMSPRVSWMLQGTWQSSNYQGTGTPTSSNAKSDYFSASVNLNRELSSFASAYLQFYYIQSNSSNLSISSNVFGGAGTYDSNRITAGVSLKF